MLRYIVNRIFSGVFILSAVLLFAFMTFSIGSLRYISDISGYEAYLLFMNSESGIIFYIFCIILAMQYPIVDKNDNLIVRLGWKKWMVYEIVSLISVIILYSIMTLAFAILLVPDFSHKWNTDFLIAMSPIENKFTEHIASVQNMTGWVLYGTISGALMTTFICNTILAVFCGLVVFAFNTKRKAGYGVLIILFIKYIPEIIMQYVFFHGNSLTGKIFKYIDLFETAKISNMKMGCYGTYMLMHQTISWLLFCVSVLLIVILGRKKICQR